MVWDDPIYLPPRQSVHVGLGDIYQWTITPGGGLLPSYTPWEETPCLTLVAVSTGATRPNPQTLPQHQPFPTHHHHPENRCTWLSLLFEPPAINSLTSCNLSRKSTLWSVPPENYPGPWSCTFKKDPLLTLIIIVVITVVFTVGCHRAWFEPAVNSQTPPLYESNVLTSHGYNPWVKNKTNYLFIYLSLCKIY